MDAGWCLFALFCRINFITDVLQLFLDGGNGKNLSTVGSSALTLSVQINFTVSIATSLETTVIKRKFFVLTNSTSGKERQLMSIRIISVDKDRVRGHVWVTRVVEKTSDVSHIGSINNKLATVFSYR